MAKFKSVIPNFSAIKTAVANQEKKGGGDAYENPLIFKPKFVQGQDETQFRIRFLPISESSINNPWIKIGLHMFERPGDGKFTKLIDPKTFDKNARNPISEYATKLWKSDNEIDKTMAKKLFVKDRYFSLVYVKEAPENQKKFVGKVLIFEFGKKMYDQLAGSIKNFGKCFWDPFKGQDFLLIIKETANPNSDNKWPDYSTSNWYGDSGVPIVDDEALMDSIAEQAELVSIKKEIVEKIGVKSVSEMEEALFGGMSQMEGASPKKVSKPAEDLTAPAVAPAKPKATFAKSEPDFGTKQEKPKAEKVVVKEEPKVVAKEEEVDVSADDFGDFENILKDEDFK